MEFDRERCVWEFQGAETELWKLPPDPLLEAVAKMLSPEQLEWSGTPTELLERLSGVSIQANILTRKLNVSADRLYNDYGIRYESKRTHEQSGQINVGKFWGVTIRDGCDGIFATM